jgi:calcineurin-like phosphoesterase
MNDNIIDGMLSAFSQTLRPNNYLTIAEGQGASTSVQKRATIALILPQHRIAMYFIS